MNDVSTPAVVLRCARHGGLGITRSLGRLGIPVYNVDPSRLAPAFFSRYSRGRFTWDLESAPPGESLPFLERVANTIGRRSILFPTSDGTVRFVAEHAAELSRWFDFSCPDAGLLRSLCNKREMHFLVGGIGLPTPECVFPQDRGTHRVSGRQRQTDIVLMMVADDCHVRLVVDWISRIL